MAIGLVTDAALSRVLQDVLELPDIPEVESHRLSELCRILHALEGLFVEDPEQVRRAAPAHTCTRLTFSVAAFLCRGICPFLAQIFLSLRVTGTQIPL